MISTSSLAAPSPAAAGYRQAAKPALLLQQVRDMRPCVSDSMAARTSHGWRRRRTERTRCGWRRRRRARRRRRRRICSAAKQTREIWPFGTIGDRAGAARSCDFARPCPRGRHHCGDPRQRTRPRSIALWPYSIIPRRIRLAACKNIEFTPTAKQCGGLPPGVCMTQGLPPGVCMPLCHSRVPLRDPHLDSAR